jgi:hypothetical protein
MPRLPDNRNQPDPHVYYWALGVLATCGVLLLAALTLNPSATSNWISDAAQAEFVNSMPLEQTPVQTAQPKEFRTVHAN